MLKQVGYRRLKCGSFAVPVGVCGAVAGNVVVKVKWCCTGALQSTTSSGVDWTDCWWIAMRWQWVHTLWGMFAIRPTTETDGLLTGHAGGRGHPGSMKQIGVHKYSSISKIAVQPFHQVLCVLDVCVSLSLHLAQVKEFRSTFISQNGNMVFTLIMTIT